MKHCLEAHEQLPDIPFEKLRGGICPSNYQFYLYYKQFMDEMHPHHNEGCFRRPRECEYYNISMEQIFGLGNTKHWKNQKFFDEFVNNKKYNDLIKNDINLLIARDLGDSVKPQITLGMEAAKVTDVKTAWTTFDGMWLDFTSKKDALDNLSKVYPGPWKYWIINGSQDLHKKYHIPKNVNKAKKWFESFNENTGKMLILI